MGLLESLSYFSHITLCSNYLPTCLYSPRREFPRGKGRVSFTTVAHQGITGTSEFLEQLNTSYSVIGVTDIKTIRADGGMYAQSNVESYITTCK